MCFKLLRIVWPERTRNTRADLELAGVDALETQYLALDNARVILLKAADLVANDDATSELQAAGQVAMEIFDCIRTSQAGKSEWEELVIYIALLFEPIMSMLEQQSTDSMDRNLKRDVDQFRQSMERILAIVKASTHNEADLERCMDVVNNSLRTFHTYTYIALRKEVSALSERISTLDPVHTTVQVDNRYSTTNIVSGDQYNTIKQLNDGPQALSEWHSPPPQPVPPEIFYGRQEIVDKHHWLYPHYNVPYDPNNWHYNLTYNWKAYYGCHVMSEPSGS